MDLDPTVIIPAILFTVLAIYLASSLLSKKPDASSSSLGNKKPKVDHGHDIPASGAQTGQPGASVEDIGAAEGIQDVPDIRSKAAPVSESPPAQEPVQLSEPVPDPVTAQEVAAMPESHPEPVSVPETVSQASAVRESLPVLETAPQSPAVPEAQSVLEPVPELVSLPKSIAQPEQLVVSEAGSEVLQPLDGSEQHDEEYFPELITDSTDDSLLPPEAVVQASPSPEVELEERETTLNNDAAEDDVTFTPEKKQAQFEPLMTEEEIEEEQRVQREQLAAIFQLLRENQEVLGEMTEGKMEEQLKLYSL